jgi:hypothetical protein
VAVEQHSIGEQQLDHRARLRVSSTTRRHVSVVRPDHAAVVLGVLGYLSPESDTRAPAAELHARAHAWLAHHDPYTVRDPASAQPITWEPDSEAAGHYRGNPSAFRGTFSAFTATAHAAGSGDWVSWEPGR